MNPDLPAGPKKVTYKSLDASVSKNLIGIWKDQNSSMSFKQGGKLEINFDNDTMQVGEWRINNRILRFIFYEGDEFEDYDTYYYYYIVSFNTKKMEYKSIYYSTDNRIWVAIRQPK